MLLGPGQAQGVRAVHIVTVIKERSTCKQKIKKTNKAHNFNVKSTLTEQ